MTAKAKAETVEQPPEPEVVVSTKEDEQRGSIPTTEEIFMRPAGSSWNPGRELAEMPEDIGHWGGRTNINEAKAQRWTRIFNSEQRLLTGHVDLLRSMHFQATVLNSVGGVGREQVISVAIGEARKFAMSGRVSTPASDRVRAQAPPPTNRPGNPE